MSVILPIVSIQHDFQSVVSDVNDGIVGEEDIWISCYKTGESSVHGKARVSLGERGENGSREIELRGRDGVLLEREGKVSAASPETSTCANKMLKEQLLCIMPIVSHKYYTRPCA